ncbi:hypothetical protein FWP33_07280 [Vibrio parahaemolyticus]|uniref:Uncharacterized protein n=1 Tax=Vibrio parahaemolyticus TaxID=670 RepID=A0A9Q3UA54_VIBPH|nr:hypothetical protein [Vibrio parahaemolyticus]ELA8176551.1 hypothetical protein [Vibrio alginolyticus]EGQ9742320.1 hypothetical protein [Vibrio parahaemolyticus]EJC7175986.1 hypothetical protein [Vibrio parahaemolyticus]EJE4724424.1 hypothetical protein [Vibrio parahaemolyticus]EJG0009718.1 hypothetical protein [Vibrio parahaemolyticus]
MNVKFFKLKNGNPWGFFVIGHVEPEMVIDALNHHITQEGFMPVTVDYVAHVWAAKVNGIPKEPLYNTHVFDEAVEGATPVTWVDGNSLEPEHHPALDSDGTIH